GVASKVVAVATGERPSRSPLRSARTPVPTAVIGPIPVMTTPCSARTGRLAMDAIDWIHSRSTFHSRPSGDGRTTRPLDSRSTAVQAACFPDPRHRSNAYMVDRRKEALDYHTDRRPGK